MARILIADDDPSVVEMLTLILQSRGHEVVDAADADGALQAFDENAPDFIVVDLAMPQGGGLRIARELRGRTPPVTCPIIILTGYADAVQETELAELNTSAVLEKPLTLDTLYAAVDVAVEQLAANS